jgi:hypothetical protein
MLLSAFNYGTETDSLRQRVEDLESALRLHVDLATDLADQLRTCQDCDNREPAEGTTVADQVCISSGDFAIFAGSAILLINVNIRGHRSDCTLAPHRWSACSYAAAAHADSVALSLRQGADA